jgi:PAS domain S-box-containing protein
MSALGQPNHINECGQALLGKKNRRSYNVWVVVSVAVAYFLSARLGLLLAFEHTNASPVWPPSGLAFAVVLILGYRTLPGIFIGAFIANAFVFLTNDASDTTTILLTSASIATGNTLEALAGGYLMNRFIGARIFLEKYQNVFRFVAIDVVMCIISSTVGALSVCIAAIAPWKMFGTLWHTWLLGDASGVLVLTPLILVWNSEYTVKWKIEGLLEHIFISLSIVFFAEAIFVQRYPLAYLSPHFYLLVPFLLWMVFRFGHREIITALTIVSAFAIWGTVHGYGPFVSPSTSLNESLLQLISFISIITVTFMALSASLSESKRTLLELKHHRDELENTIAERTHDLEQTNLRLKNEIQERESAQAILHNKTNQLTEAQRLAHIGSWEWDIKTGKEIWSEEQFRVFGYQPDETNATYDLFLNALHPEDKDAVLLAVKEALDRTRTFDMEYRIIRKDNAIRFIEARGEVVRDQEGNPEKMIGTVYDVTQRRLAEQELQLKEERYRRLFEDSPISLWEEDTAALTEFFDCLSAKGVTDFRIFFQHNPEALQHALRVLRVVDVNTAAIKLFNAPSKDTLLQQLHQTFVAESFETFMASVLAFAEGKERFEAETLCKTFDDERINVAISWTKIPAMKDRVLLSMVDITDLKHAETIMRKQQEAIESAMDGMAILNEKGEFLYLNEAHLKLFGYDDMAQLVGRTWKDLYSESEVERIESQVFPILQKTGTWEGEACATRRDGTNFSEGLSLTMIEDGKGLVCVCRDISPQKKAEAELRQTTEELARSNKELEQFAYVVSHDMQEPLRMVASYVKLLERRYKDKLDQDANEFIGFATDGAARMQILILDLLKFSRVGSAHLVQKPVECEDVLKKTLRNLQFTIEEKNALVTYDPLPIVLGDETQLLQVFQNLVSNALKFHNGKRPEVHISALPSRTGNKPEWLFSVCDNGIGLDPKDAERIFIIFQRLHDRSEYSGTGIGLAVCKKIVERHNGRIWVESAPGDGATFYFTLPQYSKIEKQHDELPRPAETH